MVYLKKKSKEINRSQHLALGIDEDGDDGKIEGSQYFDVRHQRKYAYFKYNRFKPDYYRARTCTFKIKADRLLLNIREVIAKNIRELKAAKK